ncbi:hypothetical protein CDL60_15520 [Roseateles noduli]|nr:hypothetical protein CDL60_15520 [Roseateles noduli]
MPPAAPHLSTSTGKDTIDGGGHVDVVLASPGSSWAYRVDGDDTWHAGQGDSIAAGALSRGVHAVMVAQLDDQGRPGDIATLAVRVHDEVLAPTLALAHDNGSSSTDGLSSDGTVTVSGLAAGASWFYRVNGAPGWIEGKDGQVPAGALVEGQNRIEAYQVDAGGEHGPLTSLAVTLDLTPPQAPQLQTSNGTDLLNAKDFINVTDIEGGASWKFRVNGQGDWIDGHDGRIPAAALSDGENRVEVVQVDAAGNTGAAATLTVRQDLEAPDPLQAHVDGGHGNLVSVQGGIVLDNLEDGATWKYRINGEGDWHVGSGTQLASNYLLEGRNDVTLVQTDSAGHESAATSLTVTRDTSTPDRPELVTSNGLPLINAQEGLLVHRIEDSATWEYRIDGGGWLAGQGDMLGAAALHEGSQTIDVRQIDPAGNVSQIDTLSVTLDSIAPDALVGTVHQAGGGAAADHLVNASGHVSIDNLEAGATWQFKVGDDDHWRQGAGTQLSTRYFDEGANVLQIRQIDAAGNVGADSTISLTLDTTAPTIQVIANDRVVPDDSSFQLNANSSFFVKTQGSETVSVWLGGQRYDFGQDGGASWAADLFPQGQSRFQVTATDKAGNSSTTSMWAMVDSVPPDAPGVTLKNDTGSNHADRVTSDGTVVVSGLQSMDSVGYSLDNGQHWSNWQSGNEIASSVFGPDGDKDLLVRVSDAFGNIGPTTSLHFTLDSSVI